MNLNLDAHSVLSARLHTGRLKINPAKKPKKSGQWKMYDSWVAWCRTQSRRNLHRFYGRAQKSWDPFDEWDSQKLRSVMQTSQKTKVRRSEKFKSKFLISAVRTLWNLRIDLRRRLKDRSDDAWRLAKKETGKATFFSPTNEWCLPAPSVTNPEESLLQTPARACTCWAGKTWTLPNWKP